MTIPLPPNFPVIWEHPDDAQLFWTLDRTRLPEPVTPMTYEYLQYVYHDSFNTVAEVYDLPIRIRLRRINTYCYSAMVPAKNLPAPVVRLLRRVGRWSPHAINTIIGFVARGQTKRIQARLEAVIFRLSAVWDGELLPEIKQHFNAWEALELEAASLPALLTHLDQTIVRTKRLWELHYRIIFPVHTAQSMFAELYGDLFGDEKPFDAYRLLQGFDNKLRHTDRLLWELSRTALATPAVRQALEAPGTALTLSELEQSSAGKLFLSEVRAYLNQFGRRGDKLFELSQASWIENPSPVFAILRAYMSQPERNWVTDLEGVVVARERWLAEIRQRLKNYPQTLVRQFERLLAAAQAAAVIAADHNFWIDLGAPYQARRVLLECGRRLVAAEVLEQPDDVFYLTVDEVRATAKALPSIDRRQLVAGRRAEMAYFRTVTPPPSIGAPPPWATPNMPLARAIGKALGVPPPPSAEPNVVRGLAGAPGRALGPARVIRSLAEASRLGKGDVLVIETPAAVWTSLFVLAAAVVTDAGGILSHGAAIAREYRIPAVVGTQQATRLIQDGQLLEVDGDAGMVRIVGVEHRS